MDSIFYNYLKPTGRAGFVMTSSASDGTQRKNIPRKLVQTGAVDVMIAIGNNFSIHVLCLAHFGFDEPRAGYGTER